MGSLMKNTNAAQNFGLSFSTVKVKNQVGQKCIT
jgi:hypothetical protein